MKVSKAELQKALEKVRPGLASREMIEQATSFAFMGDRVVTYNDEISVSHPVTGLDVKGAVKAKALHDFLNRVKDDEIDIEWDDKQVLISAGKAKAGLVLEQEVKLPLDEEIGQTEDWVKVPTNLVDGLKFCYPCCSRDMSHPILTCVHIKDNVVESSDSYQIARFTMNKAIEVPAFLLPATAAKELIRYNIREMAIGNGWVHFKAEGDTIFSARVLNNEYPDTTPHIGIEDGEEFKFPANMGDILSRAAVFSKTEIDTGDIPVVTIDIADSRVTMSAKNEYGWFNEDARARYSGVPVKFSVGIFFMLDIIDRLTECMIGDGKIGFHGKNWEHVVVIMAEGDE